MLLSRNKN